MRWRYDRMCVAERIGDGAACDDDYLYGDSNRSRWNDHSGRGGDCFKDDTRWFAETHCVHGAGESIVRRLFRNARAVSRAAAATVWNQRSGYRCGRAELHGCELLEHYAVNALGLSEAECRRTSISLCDCVHGKPDTVVG